MNKNTKRKVISVLKTFVLFLLFVVMATPAFADFQSSIESILDAIKAVSVPIAIILLIFAGWQRRNCGTIQNYPDLSDRIR